MHNPSSELGAPDQELVARFNAFVVEHAGRYAIGGADVQLEIYNFDPNNDPEETGYVIEIRETIESDDGEVHHLDTDYHSHQGRIMKSSVATTQDEREAHERKVQESRLEEAAEAALIGSDDPDAVIESLLRGKLRTAHDLAKLDHALSRPGPEESPADALEVAELLNTLQAAISSERPE